MGRFDERGTQYRPCAWELNGGICTRGNCKSAHGDELKETIAGYPPGWNTWRKAVQTPSHSFKASGGEARAADTTMWSSSDLRNEVLESKVELRAAVESMKSHMKEVTGILKAQAGEHSKSLAQVQVTKTETRSAGSRRAADVYSGQGTNASVTALAAEPLEEGQEGSFENCKFEGELSQGLPEWAVLEKFEEDPIALAWIDELVVCNAEHHGQIDAAYLCGTVAGGTLDDVNVPMNAVLCFTKNGLVDDPQQHTLSVLSVLLGIDFENGNEVSAVMLNDVGERLHRQGYAWIRAEAEGNFNKEQVPRLRQVAEHLGVLWQILNGSEEGEFKVRMNRGCYTHEYGGRFG